jgi:hypothetical protein
MKASFNTVSMFMIFTAFLKTIIAKKKDPLFRRVSKFHGGLHSWGTFMGDRI